MASVVDEGLPTLRQLPVVTGSKRGWPGSEEGVDLAFQYLSVVEGSFSDARV